MNVGFIGLGNIGAPMARRIVDAGLPTTLWARRRESLDPLADTGAVVVPTPADMARHCDVVGVCVLDDAAVEQVMTAEDGLLAGATPGTVIALHSTVSAGLCHRMAALAADRGAVVVDAPVSGGSGPAAEGTLLVMVGGPEEAFERCLPVFTTF